MPYPRLGGRVAHHFQTSYTKITLRNGATSGPEKIGRDRGAREAQQPPCNNQPFRIPEGDRKILVTIYTKPGCPACTQSMRLMDKLDIDYTECPITEEVLAFAKDRGLTQAPIITVYRTGDTINEALTWGGFRPEKIKQLEK